MAFKGFATGGSTPDSFAASFGGWKFYTLPGTPGIGLRRLVDNQSLLGQFRQNNDGPGWMANRTTTTPDLYRPVPFKQILPPGTTKVFDAIPFIQIINHRSPI
jgi:hypothetical protein